LLLGAEKTDSKRDRDEEQRDQRGRRGTEQRIKFMTVRANMMKKLSPGR
jgi:hypothetical protein